MNGHPLEEERAIAERISRWVDVLGHIPYRYRDIVWEYEEHACVLWQVDSFGVYYGIDTSDFTVRYIASRDVRGFWSVSPCTRNFARRKHSPTSETPIAVYRKIADAFRATELYHLDRKSTGKWIGL